mgnify:CR=1 FL=1
MQTFLQVSGALFSDGSIPKGEQAAARISLEMTLVEADFLSEVLGIVENDPFSGLAREDRDAIRNIRRSLKIAAYRHDYTNGALEF